MCSSQELNIQSITCFCPWYNPIHSLNQIERKPTMKSYVQNETKQIKWMSQITWFDCVKLPKKIRPHKFDQTDKMISIHKKTWNDWISVVMIYARFLFFIFEEIRNATWTLQLVNKVHQNRVMTHKHETNATQPTHQEAINKKWSIDYDSKLKTTNSTVCWWTHRVWVCVFVEQSW